MVAKIYVDECISQLLASLLKKEGVDAVSAYNVNMLQKSDEEHLIYAKQNNRILVTYDKADFIKITDKLNDHKGIIILSKNIPLSGYSKITRKIIDKLILIQDWSQLVIWVSPK